MLNSFDVLSAIIILILLWWIIRALFLLNTLKHIPIINPQPENFTPPGKVSILVPAKNEEANIEACILRLLNQNYAPIEIIVINDNSTDKTAAILENLKTASQGRLQVINNTPTPHGWTGKNFALYQGMKHATGDWLLFTDADTRHEPTSVSAALARALEKNLDFLTLLPRCLSHSFAEDLIQPVAMSYMGLWFPIPKMNDRFSKVIFGNGQYILMKHSLYQEIGGHEAVRTEFLEDFALMKKAKTMGAFVECALGETIYGTRMYDSFDRIWKGWRRIYLHAFERKPGLILSRALGVLVPSVFPFLLVFVNPWLGLPLVIFLLFIVWNSHAIVNARKSFAFLHPVGAFVFTLILLDAFRMALTREQTTWR